MPLRIKKSKIIGLTGGIATGKSTVTNILRALGYPVICADEIVHDLYKNDLCLHTAILKLFGAGVLNNQGLPDRDKIAKLVFDNAQLRIKLEHIIHPEVRKKIDSQIKKYTAEKYVLIFVDVPLLFETGLNQKMDEVVCVSASQSVQLKRLKKHRHMNLKQALARIHIQMPLHEKIKKSDHVIHNNRGLSELSKKVKETVSRLTESLK